MKTPFEKLETRPDESFRCFDRRINKIPARWHRHPEIELTFVPKGKGTRLVGDNVATYYDHDMVLIGSNLPHTWMSDQYRGKRLDMHEAIVTQFSMGFLGTGFFEVAEMLPIKELLQRSLRGIWYPPEVVRQIEPKLRGMLESSGADRLIRLLDVLNQLANCSTFELLATIGYTGPTSSTFETRMSFVCEYILKHFTNPDFTTGDLPKKLKMNASAFSRFFKQSTGQTPSQYLNELRVGHACRRLIDTDLSILQICYDSGFASTSNFHEVFRRMRGTSPRDYRERYASLKDSSQPVKAI